MANQRKLRLQRFGISEARYDELKAICRQYDELCRKIRTYSDGLTLTEAEIKAKNECIRKRNAIDCAIQATIEGEYNIKDALLENVTHGNTYINLSVPLSEKAFYDYRTAFFVNLDRLI